MGDVFKPHGILLMTVLRRLCNSYFMLLCVVQFRPCCQVWRLGPLDFIRHNVVSSLVTVCPSKPHVHGFLGLTSTKQGVYVTCSRPQRTATRPGLEPGTPWSVVRDANHCASQPPLCYSESRIRSRCFMSYFVLPILLLTTLKM